MPEKDSKSFLLGEVVIWLKLMIKGQSARENGFMSITRAGYWLQVGGGVVCLGW